MFMLCSMPFTPSPSIKPAASSDAACVEWRLGVCAELAEIGLELARTVRHQALAQVALQDFGERAGVKEVIGDTIVLRIEGDLGLIYSRIARGVRLSLALHERMADAGRKLAAEPPRAARASAERPEGERAAKSRDPEAAADQTTDSEREVEKETEVERLADDLVADAVERLFDDEQDEADLAAQPVGEVMAVIRRDLGLAPDQGLGRRPQVGAVERSSAKAPVQPKPFRPPPPTPVPRLQSRPRNPRVPEPTPRAAGPPSS
jgi:hypothetical protein